VHGDGLEKIIREGGFMSLKLLAGVGRTGTYSLKLAVNRLGFGRAIIWKKC